MLIRRTFVSRNRHAIPHVCGQFEIKRQLRKAEFTLLLTFEIGHVLATDDVNFVWLAALDFSDFYHVFEVILRDATRLAFVDRHVSTLRKMKGHSRADEHEDDTKVGNEISIVLPAFTNANQPTEDEVD